MKLELRGDVRFAALVEIGYKQCNEWEFCRFVGRGPALE